MTRFYAAAKLFEHGPLSYGEFKAITGWSKTSCDKQLRDLIDAGQLRRVSFGFYEAAI